MAHRAIVFAQEGATLAPALHEGLQACSVEATTVTSQSQLMNLANSLAPGCVIIMCTSDVDHGAITTAEQVRRIDRNCPLLIMASSLSTDSAISAMRAGASDLLPYSAPVQTIASAVQSLLQRFQPLAMTGAQTTRIEGGTQLVGHSAAIARLRNQIVHIAATDANVLITGESGTGKELVASLIHRNSRVSDRPFVAVNCAAVPEGLLESELFGHERGAFTGAATARQGKLQHASGGTLFLDEVGDMPLSAQAKILRAVETRVIQRLGSNVDIPLSIRLLAATNQDLEALVQERRFRQDLYFRLDVVQLNLPPLRERNEDIPELAEYILQTLALRQHRACRLESDLIRRLQMHNWPGNVRELRNVIECILVYSSSRSLGVSDLPEHIRRSMRSNPPPYGDERSKILAALNSAEWNRSKAAQILHCSRMTLYRKMVKFSVQPHGQLDLGSPVSR